MGEPPMTMNAFCLVVIASLLAVAGSAPVFEPSADVIVPETELPNEITVEARRLQRKANKVRFADLPRRYEKGHEQFRETPPTMQHRKHAPTKTKEGGTHMGPLTGRDARALDR